MNSHSERPQNIFPYTSSNHFQFGYKHPVTLETRWLGRRETDSEEFVARYGRAKSQPSSWREANILAAQEILHVCRAKNLQPVICYSGGLDSEIAVLSFLEAHRRLSILPTQNLNPPRNRLESLPEILPEIEIATLDFENGFNQHDTNYVEKFIARSREEGFKIRSERHSLDIETFLKSEEFLKIAEEAQVLSPAVVSQIWLCQQIRRSNINALPIIAQGEMHLVREADTDGTYSSKPWSLVETENLCGLYRYFIGRGLPAVPGFFQYSPEQFETQLRLNPVIHELISHSRFGKLGTRTSKAEILSCDFPKLEPRPKFTGFEKIEALYDDRRAFLAGKNPRYDSKWKLDVLTLANDLRPSVAGPLQHGDWQAAWGRDGEVRSPRSSPDDIFATEWTQNSVLTNAFVATVNKKNAHTEFLAALSEYFRKSVSSQTSVFIFDGSHIGRLFAMLAKQSRGVVTAVSATTVVPPSPAQLAEFVLKTGINDAEVFARAWPVSVNDPSIRVLIPLLHTRILNAEYDLELESTLSRPRFVWTEYELLAAVFCVCQNFRPDGCVFPWTDAKLAEAKILATKSTSWFERDEPGANNWSVFLKFIDECLLKLEESDADCSLAKEHAREFANYKRAIEANLKKLALPPTSFQISAYELPLYSTKASDLAKAFSATRLPSVLKIVSTDRWLEQAKHRVPTLRFGSNLFYQRRVAGFALLDEDSSVCVALIDQTTGEEVAWAQVSVLAAAPRGRLRIRGVTTRSDLDRKGLASKLLKHLAEHLRVATSTSKDFDSIDVFAAPEVVKAFRAAGFVDDVTRMSRNAEIVSPETGQLVTIDYELTPLTFLLGKL